MRKRIIGCISALALCIITAMGIVSLLNYKEAVTVEEQYHKRDAACDVSFSMWSIERDGIQYGFDQRGFTEEESRKYMMEIEQCIDTIRDKMKGVDFLPQDIRMQILVLNDASTSSLSGSDEVFVLNKIGLEKGEYKFPLFLSICDLPENSHSFGAYAYVFDASYSNDLIKEYLSREDKFQALNLFYPRISEEYSDKEDAEMFQQILSSFAMETIKETGLEHYLKEPATEKAINDWLQKIGSDKQYVDGGLDCMNQLEFHRDSACDLNISCGNVTYLIRDFKFAFDSVSEMEDLIVWEIKTREDMGKYLKENNAPSPMFDPEFRLTYEFMDNESGTSNAYSEDNSACIQFYDISLQTLTHELAHAYVGKDNEDKRWMNEGIAEFFSRVVFFPTLYRERYYNALRNPETMEMDSSGDYYVKAEGVPKQIEDLNMSTMIDANVYGYWCGDEELQIPILTLSIAERVSMTDFYLESYSHQGLELSYWEAESFVSYLIENSSFEDTWNCMTSDLSLEEVYGKSYSILKKEWMRNITKKFS